MTLPGKRQLQGAVTLGRCVLADLGRLASTLLVLGLVLVALSVVVACAWLLVAAALVVVTVLPTLLMVPARFLAHWMPGWLASAATLVGWLAVGDALLRPTRAASQARFRELTAALTACVDAGVPPSPKLRRRVTRVVRQQALRAVDVVIAGVQNERVLEQAAAWGRAERALRAGDYRTIAETLAGSGLLRSLP
jgi:hypothetical protein